MTRIDEATLNALKEGRMDYFEKIYRFYNKRVYNVIYAIIKDESISKDLTQDVFIQIWNKRENIDSANNFDGYIFTVTRNIAYHHIRREILMQRYVLKMKSKPDTGGHKIEENIDDGLLEQNIMKLVEELPQARRKIFLLYWKSDMKYKEIAELLSVSEKTVATQVRRSLNFLRERMSGEVLLLILLLLYLF